MSLSQACLLWQNETESLSQSEKLALVLYERNESTVTIREAADSLHSASSGEANFTKKIALFCGSEGGLSPLEIAALQKSGFLAVHLKTNILRCETAALYGIAAIQSLL